jgi:hypothetical protein
MNDLFAILPLIYLPTYSYHNMVLRNKYDNKQHLAMCFNYLFQCPGHLVFVDAKGRLCKVSSRSGDLLTG